MCLQAAEIEKEMADLVNPARCEEIRGKADKPKH